MLPDVDAYASVERAADERWFGSLRDGLKPASVALALPKLDYKLHASLKPMLRELGMRAAFEGADFSGLTPNGIAISDVIHEAVIKVFEGGTIAAAATAVIFGDASVSLPEHTVRFDRPFFYLIVDQPTGQSLFLGRVLDPSAG